MFLFTLRPDSGNDDDLPLSINSSQAAWPDHKGEILKQFRMRVPAIVGVIGERISDILNNDFEEIHLDLIRWRLGHLNEARLIALVHLWNSGLVSLRTAGSKRGGMRSIHPLILTDNFQLSN